VAWKTGKWTVAAGIDAHWTSPHGDCRNYYWEPTTGALILLNDGGAHMRHQPTKRGGKWTSLAGNTGAMEFISAQYEPTTKSWVAGAQDNSVQLGYNATASTRAVGFIGGDGTVTAIDATVSPPRFYGATQFLGNFDDDDGPGRRRLQRRPVEEEEEEKKEKDDDRVGFGYATVNPATKKLSLTGIPVLDWFDIDQFPFFDHPYALNTAAPSNGDGLPVIVWARASTARNMASGFYAVQPEHKNAPPQLLTATEGDVYRFVAGGKVEGKPDATLLVAMNNSHLLHRTQGGPLLAYPLPATFSRPVEFAFSSPNSYVLGPVSHDRTVSVAVDPADALTVAVSGWTSLQDNSGVEGVWITTDGGKTFADVTGDLANATGVCDGRAKCGKWRPSALLLLPLSKQNQPSYSALLVGTVSGVYATIVKGGAPSSWTRLGGCAQLPLVLVGGLSYEPTSDTVVAATMGRGVFTLPKASAMVAQALQL
jgi:hypothetical protein